MHIFNDINLYIFAKLQRQERIKRIILNVAGVSMIEQ